MDQTARPLIESLHGRRFSDLISQNVTRLVGFSTTGGQDIAGEIVGIYRDKMGFNCLLIGADGKDQAFPLHKINTHSVRIDMRNELADRMQAQGQDANQYKGEVLRGLNPSDMGFLDSLDRAVYFKLGLKTTRQNADLSYTLPPLPDPTMEELETFFRRVQPGQNAVIVLKDRSELPFTNPEFKRETNSLKVKGAGFETEIPLTGILDFVCKSS